MDKPLAILATAQSPIKAAGAIFGSASECTEKNSTLPLNVSIEIMLAKGIQNESYYD